MQTKEENIFYFGHNYHTKKIKADSLEEAIEEFVFSCVDFSEFANKYDDLSSYRDEPFGYTQGKRDENYSKHRYYEKIYIWNKNPCSVKTKEDKDQALVYTLTLTDFRNFHLEQKNILTYISSQQQDDENRMIAGGITQMKNHIIKASQKIRDIKLKMALDRKNSPADSQAIKLQEKMKNILKEQDLLQKKINILQTYTGIGRDVVKINSGKKSEQKKIDIFQSFRYMKEDIELLTDFEGFDGRSLEDFDNFIAEHYKELLPSEKCVQAFKIAKFHIAYEDIFMQEFMNQENNKIFILIRNGENIYRMFNDYKLHSRNLFILNNPEEEMNDLIKDEIRDKWWHFSDTVKNLFDSITDKTQGNSQRNIKTCVIPFEYNEILLKKLKDEAMEVYEAEIKRRECYIIRYNLQDELTVYSWRWGESMANFIYNSFSKYNKIRENMELSRALKNNDFLSAYSLMSNRISTYMYKTNYNREPDFCKPDFKEGIAVCEANTYRKSDRNNDFSDNFDPITAEPLEYNVLWFDFDKYFQHIRDEASKYFEEKFKEENFKNFNAMAVLQNILDSQIFNEQGIDLLFMRGIENINFIKDNNNLISNDVNKENISIDSLLVKKFQKGQNVIVARKTGEAIIYSKFYSEKLENFSFGKYQLIKCRVVSVNKDEIKLKGYLSVYKRGARAGEAKVATTALQKDWTILRSDITKDEIVKRLKNRLFRETKYLNEGLLLKSLLTFLKNRRDYNFSGGCYFK